MDTVIDQVHRRASILGPLLWGSSLPTTGNEGYEGIEYFFLLLWGKEFFFLLLWGKEIFFLLLWGKNWKGSNDLTAPLWSCMLYLWPQVRSFYSWSLGGISLGGWKSYFPPWKKCMHFLWSDTFFSTPIWHLAELEWMFLRGFWTFEWIFFLTSLRVIKNSREHTLLSFPTIEISHRMKEKLTIWVRSYSHDRLKVRTVELSHPISGLKCRKQRKTPIYTSP